MVLAKNIEVGLSINDWALPLNVEACRPYTAYNPKVREERWVNQVVITILCFYLDTRWFSKQLLGKDYKKEPWN